MSASKVARVIGIAVLWSAVSGAEIRAQFSSGQDRYQQLLRTAALVKTPDCSGTAWVCDRNRRLLITNYHVVAREFPGTVDPQTWISTPSTMGWWAEVTLVFPLYNPNGTVVAEQQAYTDDARLVSAGRLVKATVLHADPKRDLALLQAVYLPADVQALSLAAKNPTPGTRLHSIGNGGLNRALWLDGGGGIARAVLKSQWKNAWPSISGKELTFDCDAWVVLHNIHVNGGDSGGPIVNEQGELVAVTQSSDLKMNGVKLTDGLNNAIAVSEVRDFINAEASRVGPIQPDWSSWNIRVEPIPTDPVPSVPRAPGDIYQTRPKPEPGPNAEHFGNGNQAMPKESTSASSDKSLLRPVEPSGWQTYQLGLAALVACLLGVGATWTIGRRSSLR